MIHEAFAASVALIALIAAIILIADRVHSKQETLLQECLKIEEGSLS